MLVVAVNVDAFPFLAFSNLTCHLKDTRNKCSMVAFCHLIVRRWNLEVAPTWLLHQQIKILG